MGDLRSIGSIDETSAKLLESLGITSAVVLKNRDPETLLEEIEAAAAKGATIEPMPDLARVIKWIKDAERTAPRRVAAKVQAISDSEIEKLLREAPAASVVRPDRKVDLESIPEAIRVERRPAQPAAKTKAPAPAHRPKGKLAAEPEDEPEFIAPESSGPSAGPPPAKSAPQGADEAGPLIADLTREKTVKPKARGGIDIARVKTFEEYAGDPGEPASANPTGGAKRIIADAKKKAIPRGTVRGVLYPLPGRAKIGAFFCALAVFLMPVALIGTPVMMFVFPEYFFHFLWVYAALLVAAFGYIWISLKIRCRVCSCHLYHSKNCHKHVKAHRPYPLGYSFSAAVHTLLFNWVRCMYCGTAIRFKE